MKIKPNYDSLGWLALTLGLILYEVLARAIMQCQEYKYINMIMNKGMPRNVVVLLSSLMYCKLIFLLHQTPNNYILGFRMSLNVI